jgi:uncharacterized protein (TIGR00375 family)
MTKQVLDLHIHSKYSRACSSRLTLEGIDHACRIKGVDVIATGDFTYPAWFREIEEKLEEIIKNSLSKGGQASPELAEGGGLYRLKTARDEKIKFILSTELALIYKQDGRARRIHVVLHAPNVEAVRGLNEHLGKYYNIKSDGRPILGMSAVKLCELCFSISPDFIIYPAHIWTPWFSVFGSKSGFDRMEECFGVFTDRIHAIETGLSSDPEMNWRLSALDRFSILSNSDAHSPENIGREANIMELEDISYSAIKDAIEKKHESGISPEGRDKRGSRLISTIEFYPEEGMYHFDGHRACNIRLTPGEARKKRGICSACGKALTIGVLNRVEELADREEGFRPAGAVPFVKLVELDKIIAEALGVKSRASKKVQAEYEKLINSLGNEISILTDVEIEKISHASSSIIAEGVSRVREGKLIVDPGYDGVYGTVRIFSEEEREQAKQGRMF